MTGYIFTAPSLFGFVFFFALPFLMSIFYSVTKGVGNIRFVVFENFAELFSNGVFMLALKNTLLFNVVGIPVLLVLSLFAASFLNQSGAKYSFFRTLFTMPVVLPSASVVIVWQLFFAQKGTVNGILHLFGMQGPDYLQSGLAFSVLILLYLWKNGGYAMILFIAGLNNVPREYYQAAAIDGCSRSQLFFRITLPLLTPTAFFVFIIALVNSLRIYREAYLLSGQYPDSSIYMLQHFMNNNFTNLNYQRLSAASVLTFIFISVLIYTLFKFENKFDTH